MKVLYATDGGAPALNALTLWIRGAAPDRAQVTAVTVVGRSAAEEDRSSAAQIVQSAVTQLQEAGFAADKRLVKGQPGPAILNEIEEGGFDLAVLGAGNRSRLGRLLLGSVSMTVFHGSPTSVMIVHRISEVSSPIRVLFATDGSKYADMALEQLIAFLNPSSCQINVLSVAEHLMAQPAFPVPRVGYATGAPTPELEREWIAAAKEVATDAAHKLEGAGFRTEVQAVLGAPASRVLAEAHRIEADLVAVGSRGLGSVGRAAVGSVSDQIVKEASATFMGRS